MNTPKRDRITVQINQEIRELLEVLHDTEELKSPLVRRALHLGLALMTLAERHKLPVPKPHELHNWLNDYGFDPNLGRTHTNGVEEFIKNLSNGNVPNAAEITLLAKNLGIDVSRLIRLCDVVVESDKENNQILR